ncbi:ABC transporter permease [Streptomyces sp. AJS327]|uniref:ABC transporter permease n=1 Tax=Streptomyces sp. AJS327 TaxID=2545265 RepID=UPI0015DF6492|nr:ABC transporter permease [Streptomyces sp. AJS327]MBA0053580.1 ABC transporter permease [Streptomyces sp. AJS327]
MSATTISTRLTSLGRAEFSLLLRNRTAMFTALAVPVGTVVSSNSFMSNGLTSKSALNVGQMTLSAGIGMVLIMIIYSTLVASYVTRREEKVLKRLRTGECSDWEILLSTALPVIALGLAQLALLIVGISVFMDVAAPQRPDLLAVGVLLGIALMVLLAGVTAVISKTVESSQVTVMPLMLVSMFTSGMIIPLDAMPDTAARICQSLPLTPAIQLAQGGLQGGMPGTEVLTALGSALAWTALAVFAVRRWFRWEPRH